METTTRRRLGIVVPCYNEEEVLDLLINELDRFAAGCPHEVRVLFVDDGSTDGTWARLERACREQPGRYAGLSLSRNFGQQAALTAGLAHAEGDAVALLDADLQDHPDTLRELVARWGEGYEVVYGVRTRRKEGPLLRMAYAVFYRLLKRVANVSMPVDAGDFCVMDRKVVDIINAMPEHHRFLRGLRGWVGFRQLGVPYERRGRAAGQAKYTLAKLIQLAFDGFITFSSIPLRLASWIGALSAGVSLLLLLHVVTSKLFKPETPVGWASLLAVIVFFGGVQLLVLGIIGEYIGRTFDEVKGRPHYIAARRAGWVEPPAPPPPC